MRPTQPLVFTLLLLSVFHVISGQNIGGGLITVPPSNTRAITVDYDHNRFLLDGQPFRYISGSFHYFRAVPESWRKIIRLMKAAGLNAVSTYVEWSLHNPKDGVYNWTGIADLESFITICKEEDMFVLLRPGPYICAERDLGGFPVWLLNKYPNINLRTTDSSEYVVHKWTSYDRLSRFLLFWFMFIKLRSDHISKSIILVLILSLLKSYNLNKN